MIEIPKKFLNLPPLRICEDCSAEFVGSGYQIICEYCQLTKDLQRCPPLEELRRQWDESNAAEAESLELGRQLSTLEEQLKHERPWWKNLLRLAPVDERLDAIRNKIQALPRILSYWELRDLSSKINEINKLPSVRAASEAKVKTFKESDVAYKKAQDYRAAVLTHATSDYVREVFHIRKKDYKRGNPLENHFRNLLNKTIIDAYEGRCLRCRSVENLTLDHFAIPKNEGGNFVLWIPTDSSIKLNVVVLCRSCNSAKGERLFSKFFTADDIDRALAYQRALLESVLAREDTMSIVRKWYRRQ